MLIYFDRIGLHVQSSLQKVRISGYVRASNSLIHKYGRVYLGPQ
jgi:hypothetical protein